MWHLHDVVSKRLWLLFQLLIEKQKPWRRKGQTRKCESFNQNDRQVKRGFVPMTYANTEKTPSIFSSLCLLKFSFRNANHLTILLWFLLKTTFIRFSILSFSPQQQALFVLLFTDFHKLGVWEQENCFIDHTWIRYFIVRNGNMALFGSHFQSQYIVNYSRFSLCLTAAGKVW